MNIKDIHKLICRSKKYIKIEQRFKIITAIKYDAHMRGEGEGHVEPTIDLFTTKHCQLVQFK